jgi:hypothetical protein
VVVAVRPPLSVTLYRIIYVPKTFEFTELVAIIFEVKLPSSKSKAVAPGSINALPIIKFRGLDPTRLITGGVFVALPQYPLERLIVSLYIRPAGLL